MTNPTTLDDIVNLVGVAAICIMITTWVGLMLITSKLNKILERLK